MPKSKRKRERSQSQSSNNSRSSTASAPSSSSKKRKLDQQQQQLPQQQQHAVPIKDNAIKTWKRENQTCVICWTGKGDYVKEDGGEIGMPVEMFSACCGQPYHANCYVQEILKAKARARAAVASKNNKTTSSDPLKCDFCPTNFPELDDGIVDTTTTTTTTTTSRRTRRADNDNDSNNDSDSSITMSSDSDSDSSSSESSSRSSPTSNFDSDIQKIMLYTALLGHQSLLN